MLKFASEVIQNAKKNHWHSFKKKEVGQKDNVKDQVKNVVEIKFPFKVFLQILSIIYFIINFSRLTLFCQVKGNNSYQVHLEMENQSHVITAG